MKKRELWNRNILDFQLVLGSSRPQGSIIRNGRKTKNGTKGNIFEAEETTSLFSFSLYLYVNESLFNKNY